MGQKVLLCDDEIHILRAAEFKLSRAGYDVRVAHDGQEAWEQILDELPDALVTDIQMPRCDGIELARRIRENPRTKDLPVVMLSAKGFEYDRDQMVKKYGIVEMLPKPFSPRELVRLISGIFSKTTAETR